MLRAASERERERKREGEFSFVHPTMLHACLLLLLVDSGGQIELLTEVGTIRGKHVWGIIKWMLITINVAFKQKL